jgi:acetyl esterase
MQALRKERFSVLYSFTDAYFNTPEDALSLYASPIRADLTGLPPGYILTCESDTLRDEGKAYAQKLNASGVPCEYINVEGLDHGFIDVNKNVQPAVAQYQDSMFAALKKALQ